MGTRGYGILSGLSILALIVASLIFFDWLSTPQCPSDYIIDAPAETSCIVGANIGAGLGIIFVVIPLLIITVMLLAEALNGIRKTIKPKK